MPNLRQSYRHPELKGRISRNIRVLVARAGSVSKFAQLCNIDRKSVYDWSGGVCYPTTELLYRMHLYGGLDIQGFLTEDWSFDRQEGKSDG